MQKQRPILSLTLAKDNLCHILLLLFSPSMKRINMFQFDTKVSNIRLFVYTMTNAYPQNTKNKHRLSSYFLGRTFSNIIKQTQCLCSNKRLAQVFTYVLDGFTYIHLYWSLSCIQTICFSICSSKINGVTWINL